MTSDTQKTISILGSTGSIGQQTCDIIAAYPDQFRLAGMSCYRSVDKAIELARRFKPDLLIVADDEAAQLVSTALSDMPIEIGVGEAGLIQLAQRPVDIVVGAIVGFAGVAPVMAAVQAGQTIALANKEALVAAGHLIMQEAVKNNATLLPIDSEHNAVFQCLMGQRDQEISHITLTASGGPFRDFPTTELAHVTCEQALKHPNWSMGAKVTIDSATMMNKGLELIEAAWLFNKKSNELEAVIHPQSLVHALVSFVDGSILAHLGPTDMTVPISHALAYPARLPALAQPLNITRLGQLDFRPVDEAHFRCFALARQVIDAPHEAAIILNAANEVAVDAFLTKKIGFMDIPVLVEDALNTHVDSDISSVDGIAQLDQDIRRWSLRKCECLASR